MQIYKLIEIEKKNDDYSLCYDSDNFCWYICKNEQIIKESNNYQKLVTNFKNMLGLKSDNEKLFLEFANLNLEKVKLISLNSELGV